MNSSMAMKGEAITEGVAWRPQYTQYGQREIGLVMALNFLGKIISPGPKGGSYFK